MAEYLVKREVAPARGGVTSTSCGERVVGAAGTDLAGVDAKGVAGDLDRLGPDLGEDRA